jgi:hypothetical protein
MQLFNDPSRKQVTNELGVRRRDSTIEVAATPKKTAQPVTK